MGAVAHEFEVEDGGWMLELDMDERDFHRFIKRENLPADILQQRAVSTTQPPGAVSQR
jgi:hypothetical protein